MDSRFPFNFSRTISLFNIFLAAKSIFWTSCSLRILLSDGVEFHPRRCFGTWWGWMMAFRKFLDQLILLELNIRFIHLICTSLQLCFSSSILFFSILDWSFSFWFLNTRLLLQCINLDIELLNWYRSVNS